MDGLLDDIEVGERRTDEEDANAVVEEQGLLILLPRSDAVRINTAHTATHSAAHATHAAAHAAHAAAHAAHAHAATTHAAAAHTTGTTGATGHHRHREIQTTGHEELTDNNLNVGREVGAGDPGDSRTTHTTALTATAAATATTAHTTAHTTAAATDFDARDGEDATTATLLATTAAAAAAAAATLTTTTLRGDRGTYASNTFQTFHEGIGIHTPPTGVQLRCFRKTLMEHDAPFLHGIFQRLLGYLGNNL